VGGNSYLYDANGNLTQAEGRYYLYDIENRLVEVGTAPYYPLRQFVYDGDGGLRC